MKPLTLGQNLSVEAILKWAREESVLLETEGGEKFFIRLADDFATEVELLRKNREFLTFLDECKKDTASISFDEAERLLG